MHGLGHSCKEEFVTMSVLVHDFTSAPKYLLCCIDTGYDHALTDQEYKQSISLDYTYFEITEPEEIAYTYKVIKKS